MATVKPDWMMPEYDPAHACEECGGVVQPVITSLEGAPWSFLGASLSCPCRHLDSDVPWPFEEERAKGSDFILLGFSIETF